MPVKCFCDKIPLDEIVDTGSPSETIHEALARNEPESVILDMIEVDEEGSSMQRSSCMQYGHFITAKKANMCYDICSDKGGTYQPEGVECVIDYSAVGGSSVNGYTQRWDVYPLHFAIQKGYSSKIISAIMGKSEATVFRENQFFSKYPPNGQPYWIPLHFAASHGAPPEVVRELLLKFPQGLDVKDQHSEAGRTPRDLARRAGPKLSPESLALLMKPTWYWETEQVKVHEDGTASPSGSSANSPAESVGWEAGQDSAANGNNTFSAGLNTISSAASGCQAPSSSSLPSLGVAKNVMVVLAIAVAGVLLAWKLLVLLHRKQRASGDSAKWSTAVSGEEPTSSVDDQV